MKYLLNLLIIVLFAIIIIVDVIFNRENMETIELKLKEQQHNIEFNTLKKENNDLNDLLNLARENPSLIPARGYFIHLYDKIIITKGSDAKIEKGAFVINSKGLVGFVSEVKKNYSIIELLAITNKEISVRINDNYGILDINNHRLIIKGFNSTDISIGDKVYTSGLTDIPKDIMIGYIDSIEENDLTFQTFAYLKSDNKYNDYLYLLVGG